MRIFVCLIVLATAVFCSALISPINSHAAAMSPEQQASQRLIWGGRSGGFDLLWSATDINARSVHNPAEVALSVKQLAQQDFAAFRRESKDPDTGKVEKCSYERNFSIVSVVGSIVTLSDSSFTVCERAAHPGGESRYLALDLSKEGDVGYRELEMEVDPAKPGKAVKLTDIFDERDVFDALMADTVVKQAVKGTSSQPRTLPELIEALGAGASGADNLCYSVTEDLLTRFAFHHLEQGKVAVRLGLPGAGPCRYNLTELGLLLPIPSSLKTALAQADRGKEGFLMKDQKRISRGQTTSYAFDTSKRAPR